MNHSESDLPNKARYLVAELNNVIEMAAKEGIQIHLEARWIGVVPIPFEFPLYHTVATKHL